MLLLVVGGCSSVAYYGQATWGQLGVLGASRPVDEVLADPSTTGRVRAVLSRLPELRRFANAQLRLHESGSYRLYADLQREAMVWSLVAARPDSLEAHEWCYPVLGCAAYRGYFREQSAQRQADAMAAEGWDVAVLPVPAYSTLGWFSDPLPSTVIKWPISQVAGLLFHEMAHETLYLAGDSAFNEAYATVIEKEGVTRWLEQRGKAAQRAAWALGERRNGQFLGLLRATRMRLEALYASGLAGPQLGAGKQREFDRLREGYAALRESWSGYAGYDNWFDRPLNNAHLAGVSTYHAWEPAFRRVLQDVGGDMQAFHDACRQIAALPDAERQATLRALLPAASAR